MVGEASQQYVLVTQQPGAIGAEELNVYGPAEDALKLDGAAHLLADGASPPMTWKVVALQPPVWGSI